MAFDYDRAKATADRLIANFGQDVTVRTPGATTGPEWNPTPGTPSDETVQGVQLETSLFYRTQQLVQAGDIRLLIQAPEAGAPTTDTLIVIDDEVWQIVDSQPFNPGGTLLYVELIIRQ